MPDDSRDLRDHQDQNSRARAVKHEAAPEYEAAQLAHAGGTTYPLSFTTDVRMSSRGNTSAHVAVMQRAQQTYGNRVLQRYIQRATASQPALQRATDSAGTDELGSITPVSGATSTASSAGSGGTDGGAGGPAQLAGSTVEISGGVVTINAPFTKVNGVIQADTLIATNVMGSNYTPGAGNVM